MLQKFTNFHAIRSWNFRIICNEMVAPFLRHAVQMLLLLPGWPVMDLNRIRKKKWLVVHRDERAPNGWMGEDGICHEVWPGPRSRRVRWGSSFPSSHFLLPWLARFSERSWFLVNEVKQEIAKYYVDIVYVSNCCCFIILTCVCGNWVCEFGSQKGRITTDIKTYTTNSKTTRQLTDESQSATEFNTASLTSSVNQSNRLNIVNVKDRLVVM